MLTPIGQKILLLENVENEIKMNKSKANYGVITTINYDCPTGADFEAMITLVVDIIMYYIVGLHIKVK